MSLAARSRLRAGLLMVLLAGLLGACGQMGPLSLPESETTAGQNDDNDDENDSESGGDQQTSDSDGENER